MSKTRGYFFFFILFFNSTPTVAQDPQFTQFYAAPLYLNPAFAGATPCWRIGLNYRNQWFLNNRPYTTYMGAVDYNFRSIRAGAGGYVFYDNPGAGSYTTIEIAPIISKEVSLREELKLRFGLQPSYHIKYLSANGFTFGDQYTNLAPTGGGSADGVNIAPSLNFFDLSAGTVLYSEKFWLGLSIHHILRNPIMSPYPTNAVPMKISLHGGLKIELNDINESVLKPAFQLKNQGANLQADLGLYYERLPLVFGAWYRGIPVINSSSTAINQDALAFLIGLKISSLSVGYSYDLPLSRMINSFGTHEISAVFEFCVSSGKRRPPKNVRQLPCPIL